MERMRILPVILLLAAVVCGCPRDVVDDTGQRSAGTATHPWELSGWELPSELAEVSEESSAAFSAADEVTPPALRGPAFSPTDTMDPALLPGRWLQVCQVSAEKMNLVPVGEMDLLELQPNGYATYYRVEQREAQPLEGSWRKVEPGVLGLSFGTEQEGHFYGEMFAGSFLYIWNYDHQVGYWFARVPPEGTGTIEANSFSTSRGALRLADVVAQSYSGTVTGTSEVTVAGYYESGVLTMRWEDEAGSAAGFAAFIVAPDWSELAGVWWRDDYEAAPFGASWDGQREQ